MNGEFDISTLKPGDHLLYGKHDLFGWITSVKTWSPAVHVEEYIGNGASVASRNGLGVGVYRYRSSQLIGVLEPKQTINLEKAMVWFNDPWDKVSLTGVKGRPYGFAQLLHFYNIRVKTHGWICSQFIDYFDNAGDFFPFNGEFDGGAVDPGDYFESNGLNWKWVDPETRKLIDRF